MAGISTSAKECKHQLSDAVGKRILSNVQKIIDVLRHVNVSFDVSDCVFNVFSKAVLQEEAMKETVNHVCIGKKLYGDFVNERIKGNPSVWSPMKKRKLKTFRNQTKVIKCNLAEKVTQLKEERTLMTRFLIMSRQREEIDLKEILGNYELSVVPQSLFLQDGRERPCLDKSKVTYF